MHTCAARKPESSVVTPASWAGPREVGKGQGNGPSLRCLALLNVRRGLWGSWGTEGTLSVKRVTELTHSGKC